MFKTETPAGGDNFALMLSQIWDNDKLNRALNDAAVLITGLTRGKVVSWSATNSRWELYDGTVAPEATTIIGIVEYVGSPDTSGGVRVTGVYLDEALTSNTAYYCQSDGTLGTTETATFIGVCTDAGRLVMQGRGSGGGGGVAIGFGNYIADPFAVTAGTGLQALVAAHRSVIDETLIEATTQQAVTLTGKAAQLIVEDKTGALSVLLPKMTAADIVDANTVALWFLNGDASVPNAAVGVNGNTLAVANALTKNGTFNAVDGWAGGNAGKGDGSTGYYVSANSTGFPAGATVREINFFFTVPTIGANFIPFNYGGTDNSSEGIFITSAGSIAVPANGAIDTGFVVKAGETHLCTVQYDGTNRKIYIDGFLINVTGSGVTTTASVLYVGRRSDNPGGYASAATVHFIEIRNALRTAAQLAALAQKLLIPCQYGVTDIRDALANKAESQVVAFVIASATVPTTIVGPSDPKGPTADWAYGIRIGPMGLLNKVKRLGRKSFSGSTNLEWDSPFGARSVISNAEWSLDSLGTNSSPVPNDAASSYPSVLVNGKIRETIIAGVNVAGSQKTSGYVDIVAEVID